MIKTAIIIPNYNGAAYIGPCLSALIPQCGKETAVWVVDNGSSDGSEKIAESFSEVNVLRFKKNKGFTGAVNAGLKSVGKTDYVILLNNDTVVGEHFVDELVSAMERHPDAFSAQARMRRMDAPGRLDDGGDIYCALGWAFGRGSMAPADRYDREEPIFSACAGAAIYRYDVLKDMGGFDPSYFAYLEDVDLGWQARRAGWKNYYIPSANVFHAGSGTTGSRFNQFKTLYSSRNNIYVLRKNMPVLFRVLFSPMLAVGFLSKMLYFAQKGYGKEFVDGLVMGLKMPLPKGKVKSSGRQDRELAWEILKNTPRCLLDIIDMHVIIHAEGKRKNR